MNTSTSVTDNLRPSKGKQWVYNILHIIVLGLAVYLVVAISIDTFKNIPFYHQSKFMHTQFLICVAFLADFFIEWIMAPRKWHYLKTRFVFLLVSIPYLSIIQYYGWHFDPKIGYLLRFIPLVRGGYALAIVVGWFTYNRATSLFMTYLVTLFASIYFGSLVFFVFEKGVNPLVKDYYSALWWGFMDATTVGSNIVAVTPVGKVLSVLLAALGMMMFPIFTVYVTNLIQNRDKESGESPFLITNPVGGKSKSASSNGAAPSSDSTQENGAS
ncbi:MAG: potassium channel family protein [Muribaculaceae bacterium]|nr:potassium channel family protein [Muribaculaceae bacterium]